MKPSRASIAMPTYIKAQYLGQAIASALAQNYANLEVIVCDDASTDNTSSLISHLPSDSRLVYIRDQENIGRVANYRQALKRHVSGDWVLMMDGDDYLIDPNFGAGRTYIRSISHRLSACAVSWLGLDCHLARVMKYRG